MVNCCCFCGGEMPAPTAKRDKCPCPHCGREFICMYSENDARMNGIVFDDYLWQTTDGLKYSFWRDGVSR